MLPHRFLIYEIFIYINVIAWGFKPLHEVRFARKVFSSIENIDTKRNLVVSRHAFVAIGCEQEDLEIIDEALTTISFGDVAAIIVGQSDFDTQLGVLLSPSALVSRDHVIPSTELTIKGKILILSGFDRASAMNCMAVIKNDFKRSSRSVPIFAIAVPNAKLKSIRVLCSEILRDHEEFTLKAKMS